MDIYLVGGAVRDLLLGQRGSDRDFLVIGADRDDFKGRYPSARQVGLSFPIFLVNGLEYAWPRGGDLETDLASRDLTVNALALGVSPGVEGVLRLHPLALADLAGRVLRPASEHSMADDPARVFRAARFAARWPDFRAHPDLLDRMRGAGQAGLLDHLAAERVGAEVRKALATPRPGLFPALLDQTGCLAPWLAELAGASGIPAGPPPWHAADVLDHVAKVMDRLAGDPLAVWMALCHDLGKTATPPEKWPLHRGHDDLGAPLALRLGKRLRLPDTYIRAGVLAAALHMKAGRYDTLRPGTRVDLLTRLDRAGLVERLFALVAADHGRDFSGEAARDLAALRAVRLSEADRDKGPASGEKLRQLRAGAVARAMRADASRSEAAGAGRADGR